MAIAPSKLGQLIHRHWSSEPALLRKLHEAGLVNADVCDDDLKAVVRKARNEHDAMSKVAQKFNSPNERVRVFLEPYLSEKGRQWAVPLDSLDLPDDPPTSRKP